MTNSTCRTPRQWTASCLNSQRAAMGKDIGGSYDFLHATRCGLGQSALRLSVAFALAVILVPSALPAATNDALAWPPITSQARPWAWWWWHGSAVDETNISHELQRFHDAGLGGVQVTTIYGVKGAESREIPYLSPQWLQMMGYTVDQAGKLGMGVDMTLGSGWCFGGPTVSDQDANASVISQTYTVAAGARLETRFKRDSIQALMAFSADGKTIDLKEKISDAGEVNWTAPNGNWTVYAISQKPSGQKVKRPARGGEGWMLNPAYPQAMRDWLPWFDKAFADYNGSKPQAVFQDSYEYRTDWSPDFFEQFEKRRGYKLQNELPALFADASRITNHESRFTDPDHIARVKYDYRRTLSEIMATESEPAWINWAHKNGYSTIYQAHGTPGNWLDLYGDADMPETEMFHNDRNILISKFASSAAHTQGHQLTGAETGTWLKEHFTESLADMKYLADDMFLSGVNHIYYHGACYSPDDAPWPGWLFYASTEMNPRNPIWHDVRALNDYIARCQSILQEGKPDNDVLLYWPVADYWSDPNGLVQPMSVSKTEWFENQPIGKTARELWANGYAFDYVSDSQLSEAKIVDGSIHMPGGKYASIVVPKCKYIPIETLKTLIELVKEGASVAFQDSLPTNPAGLTDPKEQQLEFSQLEQQINQDTTNGFANLGKGQIWSGKPAGVVGMGEGVNLLLNHTGEIAQWGREEPFLNRQFLFPAEVKLSAIRRSFEGGWIYFIVNRGESDFDNWISFARPVRSAVILDPMTGDCGVAASRKRHQDKDDLLTQNLSPIEAHLQLKPGEALIVKVYIGKKVRGKEWKYWQPLGQLVTISSKWNVKFLEGGPTLPADFQVSKLASWTTFPDTNAQAFAGTAIYETKFNAYGLTGKTAELNLGDVRQSARVRLNGKDYGTLITPPFRVIVDNLKPTGNTLEVEVTSVAANRIRDLDRRGVNWKYFKDINIVDVDYHAFNAANWPLTDCGLLGPVTLTPVTAE